MKFPQKLIVIIFCLITVFSWAPEMRGSPEKTGYPINKTSDDLRFLNMGKGVLGFKIDSTTINEIRNKMGKAEILKGGKHEPDRFCYVSNKDQDNTVLEFETNILGHKDFFQGFALYSLKPNHLSNENCMPSDMVHKGIEALGSIRLNLDIKAVKSLLGNPTHEEKNMIIYNREYRVPWPDNWYTDNNQPVPNEKDNYIVSIDIWGQFEKGKLKIFKISQYSNM